MDGDVPTEDGGIGCAVGSEDDGFDSGGCRVIDHGDPDLCDFAAGHADASAGDLAAFCGAAEDVFYFEGGEAGDAGEVSGDRIGADGGS